MAREYSDQELVQMIKQNDSSAFSELVNRYRARALGSAYSLVGNRQDAEDITQEAFIRVYKGLAWFREKSDFFTWFYRIIINLCRDYQRKKFRSGFSQVSIGPYSKEETDAEHVSLENTETDISKSDNPAKATIDHELNQKISGAINVLPDRQRIAFSLKHLEGLTIKDISHIMKCSEGTVKAHLWRAISRLQRLLEPYISQ